MSHKDSTTWLLYAAAAAAVYYALQSSGAIPAAATPTPLSIYPEYAYTAQTSMAASPGQKAPTKVLPTPYFTAVQAQEQSAILGQCVGSYPGCTVLLADTQLGF